MDKTLYDIIIVGAGPAGLTAAVELSKHFKVLVLEQHKPGLTRATWYSYADRAMKYGLDDAVAFRTDYIRFVAPSEEHLMKDDCVVFDHDKVMQILLSRAVKRGAVVKQAKFLQFETLENGVQVDSNKGTFTGRLLIDAMGIKSPILQKHNLIKRKDAWVIYGGRFENSPKEYTEQLSYYPIHDHENTYVGVHPLGNNQSSVYLFKGQNNTLGEPSELKEKFQEFAKKKLPDAKQVETLRGTIVSGTLKKYALNRVVFFGSSGMLNPDACGMGFNEILLKHRIFSREITKALLQDALDANILGKIADKLRDKETINFQRIIGAFSLYFIKSTSKWDGGVKWLNAMGVESKNWMRNEMDIEWVKRATIKLHKVIPLSETVKMIPYDELIFILSQLARFAYNSNLILNKKHKRTLKRLLQKMD